MACRQIKGYVLTVNGKRLKTSDGKLTPFFINLEQCMKYWRKYLFCSPAVEFHKIKKDGV